MSTRCLLLLCAIALTLAEPAPGRIPKVYNALITSNQNLEPSKAYPVYQPVLRSAFPFPLQPVFYGDIPYTNNLPPPLSPLPAVPNQVTPSVETASPSSEAPKQESSTDNPPEASPQPKTNQATEAPPLPPKTESPIPLNEFGLPPQVFPLGNFGSGYEFTQINTYPYSYPGLRFYDPYDQFLFNPYTNFPLYRPLANALAPLPTIQEQVPKALPNPESSEAGVGGSPPVEPNDLNVLNYSAKDPAIPNVPPPPLPQGGLKSDKE